MVDEPKVKVKVYLEDFLAKFQLVANKVTSWSGTASDDKYPSAKLVKDSLDGKSDNGHTHNKSDITDFTHAHGNLTNDGKLGTTANKPLITGTGGVITTGSFGTSANTFCQGNDSRLSDARTPLAHTHDLDDITDYIVTSISCSDYNPTIDSTVTVTVFVGDSEGVGIQGVSVPVTCSSGQFTKLNNNTITAASTVTGTTGANGTFTLTYSCTEWGLITFSANNMYNQIKVTGFKKVLNNITYSLWVDESTKTAAVLANRSGITINAGDGFNYNDFKIPSNYRPSTNSFVTVGRTTPGVINYIWADGTVGIYNNGSQMTNYDLNFRHEYHF